MSALCVSFLLNCWYHFPSQCPLCVLYLFSALSCRVGTLQISLIIISQLAPVLNWEITDFIKSKSFEPRHKISHQNCHPGLLCGAFCGLWSSFNTCNHTDVFSSHSFHHYSDKSVHFSLGNSIFTLHACISSVPTKLQQARKKPGRIAQTRNFWNVDHVAAVQLWDGGHYSSSSLTPLLLSKHKRDMSGSKNMWNLTSLNFYNEEAGFASKCTVLKVYLSAQNLFSFPLQVFVCNLETGKCMGWGSEGVKNGKHYRYRNDCHVSTWLL